MIGKQFLTARNYLSMAIRNRRRLIRRKRGCHGWKRIWVAIRESFAW